ncbi:MAG: GntR family transcriptional regulator [Paracoccus sp. (in: a-proteobacteria)]|nr:GntR family transcriptional regulator [Paracoccus sp. (in: a-proteobacteria)]
MVQALVQQITARIAAGEYPPGSRLPAERQFAAALSVARNTLREALSILQRQNLIHRRGGAGNYVAEDVAFATVPQVETLAGPVHLHVMRGILEPEIARLAVLNMSPTIMAQLFGIVEKMNGLDDDPLGFARQEENFYLKLAEGTGNPLLQGCYQIVVRARQQPYHDAMLQRHVTPLRIDRQLRGYETLLAALAARDIPEATVQVQELLLAEQRMFMQED